MSALSIRSTFIAIFAVLSLSIGALAQDQGADDNFDRMDGTGASGKTVNVIEWEGNLEIHVAPPGSLKGLALKLDKANKSRPVMVIGYRFDNAPKTQLIRRAILGIDLKEGFKVYRDKSVGEYDKIVITNSSLSGQDLASFRLDPAPTQLYPDGHPALAKSQAPDTRAPASAENGADNSKDPNAAAKKARAARQRLDEDGTIQPFFGGGRGGQQAGTVPATGSDQ